MTQNDLNHLTVQSTLYTLNTIPKTQISHRFVPRVTTSRFWDTSLSKIGTAPNDLRVTSRTELSKGHCIPWIFAPRPKFHSISLYDQPFSRAVFKSRFQACQISKMHRMTQNDLKHLTDKRTLYTLNTHPRRLYYTPFRSTTIRFPATSLPKIGNAPNDPRMTLTT